MDGLLLLLAGRQPGRSWPCSPCWLEGALPPMPAPCFHRLSAEVPKRNQKRCSVLSTTELGQPKVLCSGRGRTGFRVPCCC